MKRTYIHCNLFNKLVEFDRYWKTNNETTPVGVVDKQEISTTFVSPVLCPCQYKDAGCKNPMLFVEQGKQSGWRNS